jgi:type I restriction enzyme S subunit
MKEQLPQGWVKASLGDMALLNPKPPSDSYAQDLEVSFLPMKAVSAETGEFDASEIRRYCEVKKGYTPCADNDILFAKITPCMENGKVAVVSGLKNRIGFGSTEFHVVRPVLGELPRKLFLYYLLRGSFRRHARLHMTGSAGQLRVPVSYLDEAIFLLPPLAEQHRIVAKIEELFSDLDAGVETLKKLRTLIKRYRQSVLKAAFEGKLTEEWREEHKDELEPASVLLERIREERKKTAKEQGKKYKEPPPVDTSNLPELSGGWEWASFAEVMENHDGTRIPVSRKERANRQGSYPYYGASGVIDTIDDYLFDGSYLLIGEDGANLLARSTPIAFQAHGQFWVNNHAHVLLTYGGIPLAYCEQYINSIDLAPYVTGTAQPKLPQSSMNKIPIAVAPFLEQKEIATSIERLYSIADKAKEVIGQSLVESKRLHQSILKRAFEGKLVPQDPNDERAEKLLEQIKAEKAKMQAAKPGKDRSTRKKRSKEVEETF